MTVIGFSMIVRRSPVLQMQMASRNRPISQMGGGRGLGPLRKGQGPLIPDLKDKVKGSLTCDATTENLDYDIRCTYLCLCVLPPINCVFTSVSSAVR